MAQTFQIWGDYGYENESMIIDFDSEWQARDFFSDSVQSGEYDDEYELIELAYFRDDGEYVIMMRHEPGEDRFTAEDEFVMDEL